MQLKRSGKVEVKRTNIMETIQPGDTVTNMNPGGGGYGNPFERPVDKVVWDVKNGLVSIRGAKEDYGVVITDPETLKSTWPQPARSARPPEERDHHMRTQYRLGIDAGGTFTDFVVARRDTGEVRLFKALSTPPTRPRPSKTA